MRPKVRYLETELENHMITPTNAKAVRSPLAANAWEMVDMRLPGAFRGAGLPRFDLIHGFDRAAHPADQGHGAKADDESANGCHKHDGTAFDRRNHILLRRHGNNDRYVQRAPESYAQLHAWAQRAMPDEPQTGANQHNHGNAHSADIGLDAQRDTEPVAQKSTQQRADREQRNARYRHAQALPPFQSVRVDDGWQAR